MTEALDHNALTRWRSALIDFIEQHLHDPETGAPYVLLDAERDFLDYAFRADADGRLLYPEMLYSAPKKSGKTAFAALVTLTLLLLFGGNYPEAVCCANDLEQSIGRVFTMIRRIVEASPLLRRAAKITSDKITFPKLDIVITAIPSDFAGAAGGNQNIATFDELWAFTSERSRRLFDEMVPPPTRKIAARLTVTYAGFCGESVLLEELYKRGQQLPVVAKDLRAGDGLLMFWSHEPVAPWQGEKWLAEMRRSMRPSAYARMIRNEFVSPESAFVDLTDWDNAVVPSLRPMLRDPRLPVYVGVDASVKRDSTALVGVTIDKATGTVRLVVHKIFTPGPGRPIDFGVVEDTLLQWKQRFMLKKILFDPFQMAAVAQRLARAGLPIEEYPQTSSNLTTATANLFDLLQSGKLVLYYDAAMRLAASRAIIVESPRGLRVDKTRQSDKIDCVVALSMAALAASRAANAPVGRWGTVDVNGKITWQGDEEFHNALSPGPHAECRPGKGLVPPKFVRSS